MCAFAFQCARKLRFVSFDSGKTTLAQCISTTASTAAFDKNPQSRERGITLDLGFSSFCIDNPPPHVVQQSPGCKQIQVSRVM